MCEFQRIKISPEGKELPPMCDYTKDFCTLCVLGNAKTYNEAVKQRVTTMPNEWISVEERTPKPYVNVLVFTPNDMPNGSVCEGCFDEFGNCYSRFRQVLHGLANVTHWMPKPLPPDEYLEQYIKGGVDNA